MTIKLELAALGATLLGAAGFFASAPPLSEPAPIERAAGFVEADYAAFDRNFRHGRETCAIGVVRHQICFQPSPLEAQLVKGEQLADHVPLMPAEMAVLVATPTKSEDTKLVRFGRSLALIDPETRRVHDVIRLDASTYADAMQPLQRDLALAETTDAGA